MKKSILIILLVISSLICSAQLQVKEGSFKKVEGFVNINTEKMFDDNDRPYAVLKIKTENINDKQRRELSFGGDAQTFFETEYKDGEVWLYISYYATFLKISHPDLSSTEFWFPFDMEPKRGYELTLVNKPALDEEIISRIEKLENSKTAVSGNPDNYGYIVIKTGSLEGATVYIDGEEMEMKTPFVSDPIEQGPHKIRVVKDGYETFSDIVAVEGKGMNTVNVNLKKEKTINPFRHKGFVFTPEINFSIIGGWSEATWAIIPQFNLEYMVSSKFGLGVGTGLMHTDTDINAIPLYGQFSYYFTDRKVSPFINLKAGYLINITEYDYNSDTKYKYEGFYGSLKIGININHSQIGFSIGLYHWEEAVNHTEFISYYTGDRRIYSITYSYIIPFGKKE
ncbi:MAG: PEGA domain-containing protein [Bacteroidales bacterium]|nr:PEGA domain-containing protein [Bacteroidales bacterium]